MSLCKWPAYGYNKKTVSREESSWEGLVATSFFNLFFYNKKMNKKYNWIIDLKII